LAYPIASNGNYLDIASTAAKMMNAIVFFLQNISDIIDQCRPKQRDSRYLI
jgi:hypothetical protein